ncbi:MAG: lipoprotein [Methylotetracoccus sp.]|nr:lipoprotein [Methylotetracoccus sp.]
MPKHVLAALLLVVSVSGCGQKGPLILPPPEGAETQQQQDQNKSNK